MFLLFKTWFFCSLCAKLENEPTSKKVECSFKLIPVCSCFYLETLGFLLKQLNKYASKFRYQDLWFS